MNYKSFIRNQRLRFLILRMLSFISDTMMVKIQYRIKTGKKLNLKNPCRYTEKLQLYKIHYRNPLMFTCADKCAVRDYLENTGYGQYLIPSYGISNNADNIDWSSLPNQFVIKTNDGGGGKNVLICKDKLNLDIANTISKISKWKNMKSINAGREWAYTGIKESKFLIEKLISPSVGQLFDYKFFCFNGKVEYLYVVTDRNLGDKCAVNILDKDFNRLKVSRMDEMPGNSILDRPKNYEDMVRLAEELSNPFPHVRIDLYNVDEQIYFGEFTFYDGSGYMSFDPDDFDFELGGKFDISSFTGNES